MSGLRSIVASVGFNWRRVWSGIAAVGLERDSRVVLVNSLPRTSRAEEAMATLESRVRELYAGSTVSRVWLDPSEDFGANVARIRDEALWSPGGVFFVASGGLRWLVLALSYAAQSLSALSRMSGVWVAGFRFDLEEEAEGVEADVEGVVVLDWIPPLAEVTCDEVVILDAILSLGGRAKAASISRLLGGVARTTIHRRLVRLRGKGLVRSEARWRGYVYSLTALGRMLAGSGVCRGRR